MTLSQADIADLVASALIEDIGPGDVTTQAVVPAGTQARAVMLAKQAGTLCGFDVARETFYQVDPEIEFDQRVPEGHATAGNREVLAVITGSAAGILTGERVVLNFMQRMSGVSTLTAQFVKAAGPTTARVIDTRKTTPGLRLLEKYAVRVGGGVNHRYGLSDGVMIKDNHIVAAGGIGAAVAKARQHAHHLLKIEVECKLLAQVQEALDARADVIMLDNMDLATMREAVALIGGRAITEASGGVNLQTIGDIAQTGVDLISVGAVTHSATALDISLDFTLL